MISKGSFDTEIFILPSEEYIAFKILKLKTITSNMIDFQKHKKKS